MTLHPLKFSDMYHSGIVVNDINSAKLELTDALGVTWPHAGEQEMPIWTPDGVATIAFGYAYSAEGPHRLELIQAVPDTLWQLTGRGQAHHTGFWSSDVAAASEYLASKGLSLAAKIGVQDADADAPIVYHRAESGLFIEIVDRALEPFIFGSAA